MISLAPDPTLPGAVPEGVMVGRREGGREELRHKVVMIEGVGADELDLLLQDSSCLNLIKGETWSSLGDAVLVEFLPGVGEEG